MAEVPAASESVQDLSDDATATSAEQEKLRVLRSSAKAKLLDLRGNGFLTAEEIAHLAKTDTQLNNELGNESFYVEITETLDKISRRAKSRFDEAFNRPILINMLLQTFERLAEEEELIPTKQKKKKKKQSLAGKQWLDEKMQQQLLLSDIEDPVLTCADLNKLNRQLLQDTMWDSSLDNKGKTNENRSALDSFDTTPKERLIFNPLHNSYTTFIKYLRDRLRDHEQFGALQSEEGQFEDILHCHLLEFQTKAANQPPRWMILDLRTETASTDIYMRSDNLYVTAFSNKKKQVYELSHKSGIQLIRGSIMFGCSSDYPQLLDSSDNDVVTARITQLILNMRAIEGDIQRLSDYDHTVFATIKRQREAQIEVQKSLARIAVVFAEVSRLIEIFDLVDHHWDNIQGCYLTKLLFAHIRFWKRMCDAIRNYYKGRTLSEAIYEATKMRFAYQAFKAIFLVCNTKGAGLPYKPLKEIKKPQNQHGPKPPPSDGNDNPGKDYRDGGKKSEDAHDGPAGPGTCDGVNKHGTSSKDHVLSPVKLSQEECSGLFELLRSGRKDVMATTRPAGPADKETCDVGDDHGIRKHDVLLGVALSQEQSLGKTVLTKTLLSSSNALNKLLPELICHRDELLGQPLVQVFKVHTNCSSINSVGIYDDHGGDYVYKSNIGEARQYFSHQRDWLSTHIGREPSDFMHELLITGPDRAMSACPSFMIEVDVSGESGVFQLPWDWDWEDVNEPTTRTIFTWRGNVHVTAAVLSNAVEASIDVQLRFHSKMMFDNIDVKGDLELRTDNMSIGCTIFRNCTKEPNDAVSFTQKWTPKEEASDPAPLILRGTQEDNDAIALLLNRTGTRVEIISEECETEFEAELRLARSTFALPVGSNVHISGWLCLMGGSDLLISVDESISLEGHCTRSEWVLNSHCSAVVCINASSF